MTNSKYIISLGGSIIIPREIDRAFLKKFAKFILARVKKGDQFFIVTGGGALARKYQAEACTLGRISDYDLDLIGIVATRINAYLLRSIFGTMASPEIVADPTKKMAGLKKITLAGGWKPGASTDHVAVQLAKTYQIKKVINLSNVDYVYTADPRTSKTAKKLKKITWAEFQKQFGRRWQPGANLPFDPVAAALAKKQGIEVFIMNGKNLANLARFISGKAFIGTHLH